MGNGCLRVRGPAKSLDLLMLSYDVQQLFEKYAKGTEVLVSKLVSNRDLLASEIRQNREAIIEGTLSHIEGRDDHCKQAGATVHPWPLASGTQRAAEEADARPSGAKTAAEQPTF